MAGESFDDYRYAFMTPKSLSVSLRQVPRYGLAAIVVLTVVACSSSGIYRQNLMNAPDIYDEGGIDPFVDINPIDLDGQRGILYATDREPADEPTKAPFYGSSRGNVLRLGFARIHLAKEGATWEEARRISLLKNRTEDFPLQVAGIHEYGVLGRSVTDLDDPSIVAHKSALPGKLFAERVNAQLARSSVKDVFIDSPWVSSDILVTLRYDLLPGERGLTRSDEDPMWRFPPDYIANLRETIFRVNPALAERAKRQSVGANQ